MTEAFILSFGLLFILLSLVTVTTLRWTWNAYGFFIGSMLMTGWTGLNFVLGGSFFSLFYFLVLSSFSVRYRDIFLVSLSFLDWTSWSCWGSTSWTQLALCDFQGLTLWMGLMAMVVVLHSGLYYDYEYILLLLLLIMATLFLLQLDQLVLIYLGLELQALILYVLVTYYRFEETHTEAGLKYLLLGSLVSGFFLLGMLLVYYQNGTLNWDELIYFDLTVYFVMVLLFKLTSFPFYFWSPSVYQALDWTTFWVVSTLPKCSAWYLLIYTWWTAVEQTSNLLYGLSFSSILAGSIGGLYQLSITSMMAYSGVLNTGYLLLFHSLPQVIIFYFGFYILISGLLIGALSFGSTLAHLVRPSGWWVFFLVINLAGLPMIPGFIGKLYLLSYSLQQNYSEVVFIVGSGLVAVLYYLGLINSGFSFTRNHEVSFSWIYSVFVLIIGYLQLDSISELALALVPLTNYKMGFGARDNKFWKEFKFSCKDLKPVVNPLRHPDIKIAPSLKFDILSKGKPLAWYSGLNFSRPSQAVELGSVQTADSTVQELATLKQQNLVFAQTADSTVQELATLNDRLGDVKVHHLSMVSLCQETYVQLRQGIVSILERFETTKTELSVTKAELSVTKTELSLLRLSFWPPKRQVKLSLRILLVF